MTTTTQPPPPGATPVPLLPSRLSEIGVWALLLVMAGVDAAGFWIILTRLLFDSPQFLLAAVVAGTALASVVLPHTAGVIARRRSEGYHGNPLLLVVATAAWLAIGGLLYYTRFAGERPADTTGSQPGGGVLGGIGQCSSDSTADPGLVVAGLLTALYVATALVAFWHAWERSGPTDAEERLLIKAYERALRHANNAAYEQQLAQRRVQEAVDENARLLARRDLHFEFNEAAGEVITQRGVSEMGRRLGNPAALDALSQTNHAASPPRAGQTI